MCVIERCCICLLYSLHYINTVYFCVRYVIVMSIFDGLSQEIVLTINYSAQKNNLSLHNILYTFYSSIHETFFSSGSF